jgi:sialate O-acetylesterase
MRLASIWSDHAVIQRNKPVVVWGWCDAKRTVVRGTLGADRVAQGLSSWDGRFELRFPALESGGPLEMRITCGSEECVVRDLVVGEVWLVSGQSNAEFPLMTFAPNPNDPLDQTKDFLKEGGVDPLLRCFTTKNDGVYNPGYELTPGAEWRLSNENTAPQFTAIGAWFALNLRKRFPEVPVGIVHSSWGGTVVSAWLSREAFAARPENRAALRKSEEMSNDPERWKTLLKDQETLESGLGDEASIDFAKITERDRGNQGFAKGYASPDLDDSQWGTLQIPGSWMGQNFSTHGAIWVRKAVEIPASWAGQPLELHLGPVDKHDITYFNGVQVGATGKDFETQHWCVPRVYPVPGELVKAGRNVVAVRAFCFYYDGSLGGSRSLYFLKNTVTGETISLCEERHWKAIVEYAFTPSSLNPRFYSAPSDQNSPHRLFDNKIRPLIPFAIRGVLWYQGESDTDQEETTNLYFMRFCDLIHDWRRAWGQGDEFPFFFVQLANYESPVADRWLRIQDAQRRAYLAVPNTGVITASDLALFEAQDIHPHDKRSFGYRLSLQALSRVYGDATVVPQGPTLDFISHQGTAKLCLHFQYGQGLHAEGAEELKGFEVAGADGVFYPAQAEIQGDCVVLNSSEVAEASAVRYNAEVGHPEGNLRNGAGLPALSFIQKA